MEKSILDDFLKYRKEKLKRNKIKIIYLLFGITIGTGGFISFGYFVGWKAAVSLFFVCWAIFIQIRV